MQKNNFVTKQLFHHRTASVRAEISRGNKKAVEKCKENRRVIHLLCHKVEFRDLTPSEPDSEPLYFHEPERVPLEDDSPRVVELD